MPILSIEGTTPKHEWENRIDRLLTDNGLPADSIHVQHGTDFKAHEILLAGRFAESGHDVELLYASSAGGSHTPDFRIDGVLMEAKRLEAWSIDRLGKKIHEASARSRDVIIDLSIETVPHKAAIQKARDVMGQPMYRFLSKYERKHGFGRGNKELRIDSVTLVFHDRIEALSR